MAHPKFEVSLTEARSVWKDYEDSEGWISKTPEEIAEDIEDFDDQRVTMEALWRSMNFYEIEYEQPSESRWRFTEEP